jgi:hypothetical protein
VGLEQAAALEAWERKHGYVRATLHLLPTADGGKRSSMPTGFRAAWDFGERTSDDVLVVHDGPLLLEDTEMLAPGQTAVVRIHPLHPESWPAMTPGHTFHLWEAQRVGEARFIERVSPSA